ncbi:putative inorganic phosphate cotransporter [Penaeus japonicus]|uniref:putative inorganic phosphate cotransporter n=1 Tax=Penaeus japonicus TaxID=27405 RepID=UPI001C70F81F|nr:putative inorganic phosphate cotransporter [Penaeus japonicus]
MSRVGRRAPEDVIRKMEEEEEEQLIVPQVQPEECFGARHVLALMGFLGFANVYAMRVNLSVAIVAMVNNTAIPHVNKTESDACPVPSGNQTEPSQDGEFVWTEYEQGLILGSFFWGYVLTNMLGGRLGEVFGGKLVFGFGVLVTAILTLLTPVVARVSTPLLIALRVVEGLGEGVTFPAMNSMMAKWIPPLERSKMGSLVYAGAQFGTVVSLPISGLLCQSNFLGGWPSVFYVFGASGVVWFILWMVLVYKTPESHPRISLDEKIYIQTTLNQSPSDSGAKKIPWKHILLSMPFWAIFVGHIAQNWGFYTLLTELPTYMKNILHFNIASNSFVSALPYLIMWLFSIASGLLADHLRTQGILTTTATRKIFNSIGLYGPMICLVLVGYADCNKDAAIGLLCGAVGLNGAVYSGYMNSHLDLAPNFAGTLMGITNTFATIPGFVAPQVVGMLISGHETIGRWRIVFWIAGIVYFIGNTFYIIFISGEQQEWNDLDNPRDETKVIHGASSLSQYGSLNQRGSHLNPTSAVDGGTSPTTIPEIF